MRLINVRTLELQWFGDAPPPYAILSHTWDARELSLQDLQDPNKRRSPGFKKLSDFCRLVLWLSRKPDPNAGRHHLLGLPNMSGISWAWVDTVCIDKSSSSELSEAINSMWRYYAESRYCIAYLSDAAGDHPRTLRHCQWFSRGWTLQELLAPMHVLFYSQFWRLVGSRDELATKDSWLVEATGIEAVFLEKYTNVRSASVAQRMGWAARRRTTRQEDMAYCLMGLFDVNMPLLYGEGWSKAFLRLQSEIIRQSDDESIFVFYKQPNVAHSGVLAKHPAAFKHSTLVRTQSRVERSPFMVTHKGLQIDGPALGIKTTNTYPDQFIIKLNCVHLLRTASDRRRSEPDIVRSCVLVVQQVGHIYVRKPQLEEEVLHMTSGQVLERIESHDWERIVSRQFIIALTDEAAEDVLRMTGRVAIDLSVPQYLTRPETKCIDSDSEWFEGIREEEFQVKLEDVIDT